MGCCSSDRKNTNTVPDKKKSRNRPGKKSGKVDYESEASESDSYIVNEKERLIHEWKKAVQASDNKKLKHLIKNHAKEVDFRRINFENGDNSLHYAVRSGNINLCKFLILIKVNVNSQNRENGNTPLHYAVQQNDSRMIKELYTAKKQKCRSNILNKDNKTAIDVAKQQSNSEQLLRLIHDYEQARSNNNGTGAGGNSEMNSAEHAAFTNSLMVDSGGNGMGNSGSDMDGDRNTKITSPQSSFDGNSEIGRNSLISASAQLYKQNSQEPSVSHSGSSHGGGGGDNDGNESSRESSTMNGIDLGDNVGSEAVILAGYMDKKRHKAPHIWQTRWVVLNRKCMLWSEKKVNVEDHMDDSNKDFTKLFAGYIEISSIVSVTNKQSKDVQNKFIVKCKSSHHGNKTKKKEKEYMFRCDNPRVRDQWVREIGKLLV